MKDKREDRREGKKERKGERRKERKKFRRREAVAKERWRRNGEGASYGSERLHVSVKRGWCV